jgi:hypothetical protein
MEPQFYPETPKHLGAGLLLAIPVSLVLWFALLELVF